MRHLSLYLKHPVYALAGRRTPRPKRTQAPVDTVDNAGAHDLMTLRSAPPVDAAGRVAAPSARSRLRLAITFTCVAHRVDGGGAPGPSPASADDLCQAGSVPASLSRMLLDSARRTGIPQWSPV